MEPIHGVTFYQGDATDPQLITRVLNKHGKFDCIVSDMAPNFTGTAFETHQEMISLNMMSLSLSAKSLT